VQLLKIEERNFTRYDVYFSKISDYNKILKLKGEKEITLNKNEVLILSSSGGAINLPYIHSTTLTNGCPTTSILKTDTFWQ